MAFGFDLTNAYIITGDINPTTQVLETVSGSFVANNAAAHLAWLTSGGFSFYTPILSAADNGGGLVRLTLTDGSLLQTGQYFRVQNSTTYDANYQITKISTDVVDLVGSTYAGALVSNTGQTASLQGAAIITTAAAALQLFDDYARASWKIGGALINSAVDVTLTNPPKSLYRVNMSASGKSITLPAMNLPISLPTGTVIELINIGSNSFALKANGGTTLLSTIRSGDTARYSLGTNSNASGVGNSYTRVIPEYAETTWTPVLTFATPGDLSVAYTKQGGTFTKKGREVTLNLDIVTSSFTHTTASGNLQITGVPYTADSGMNFACGLGYWQGITKAGYTDMGLRLDASAVLLNVIANASASSSSLVTATDTPTGGSVILRGTIVFNIL